ncbi:MAG: hypothetical protein IJ769_00495 [Clostridia bacterium]|nr:hypothetical protein [Clostridia bacterium]
MMERNETREAVREIEIAGRTLELRYTVNSLCALEERAGMPIDRLMDRQFSATRLLLWAGLVEAQPNLTVHDVGALIGDSIAQGGSLEDIVDVCADGLREAGFFGHDAGKV